MCAARAVGEFGASSAGVDRIAPNAVKRGTAPLALEAEMIAVVEIKPKAQKHRGDKHAVQNDGGGEFEHLR